MLGAMATPEGPGGALGHSGYMQSLSEAEQGETASLFFQKAKEQHF